MKAIIILIISAALVLQCQSKLVDTSQMSDYLDASREAWYNTYNTVAAAHYDYTGRIAVANMDSDPQNLNPSNKMVSYGENCDLLNAGKAFESTSETRRNALYSLRITWNPREAPKAQSTFDQANSAFETAKRNYDSKIDCDNKAFEAFKAKMTDRGRGWRTKGKNYWVTLLAEERKRYNKYSTESGNTWFSIVYGDKCGVFKNWNIWNDAQYETNWATFLKNRWEGQNSKGELGQKAYQASVTNKNAWDAYQASQACEKANPIHQATLVEIDNWKKKDIIDAQNMFARAAAAKIRSNDPCILESNVVDWVSSLQSKRMHNYITRSSRTSEILYAEMKLMRIPYIDHKNAANNWAKGLQCDDMDIAKLAAEKAVEESGTAPNSAARDRASKKNEQARKAAQDANARNNDARNSYMSRLQTDAENYANKNYWGQNLNTYCRPGYLHLTIPSWLQSSIPRKCKVYESMWKRDVDAYVRDHKKDYDGKDRRRMSIFSH